MAAVVGVCLVGGRGRLGRAIAEHLATAPGWGVAAVVTSGRTAAAAAPAASAPIVGSLAQGLSRAQLVIDVSAPSAAAQVAPACARRDLPLLVASSDLGPAQRRALARAGRRVAVLWAANLSPQVAAMLALAQQVGPALAAAGQPAAAAVREAHHRHKRDAPSATALRLAAAVGQPAQQVVAQRLGELPGEHSVLWVGAGEQLELTHRCQDREVFARGALAAARWLRRQPAGLYGVADWLGQAGPAPAARRRSR